MKRRCGSNLASVLSIASPIKGAAPKLDRLGIDERPSSKRSQSQLRIWNDASLRFLRRITEFVVGRAEMDHTGGRRCRAGLPRRYFLRRALWVRRALWIRFPGPPVHSRVGDRNDDFGRQNACQRRVAGRSAHLCDDIRRGEQQAGYDGIGLGDPEVEVITISLTQRFRRAFDNPGDGKGRLSLPGWRTRSVRRSGTESSQTLCWREMDSNLQYRAVKGKFVPSASVSSRLELRM